MPNSLKYFLVGVFLTFIHCVNAQSELSELFKKGSHSVGFFSTVNLDPTQHYPFYKDSSRYDEKSPKPVLINVWYPAVFSRETIPMKWQGYLEFESKEPQIRKWLSLYRTYTEKSLITELFKKDITELDSLDKKNYDRFLSTSTTVVRNAKMKNGKYPFVLYAQGAGGTIEDNALFCAALASHGYIVIGSSFQYNEASDMGPQGPPAGIRDVIFLLNYAWSLSNIDYSKAGMIGHSLGAQKMISFLSHGDTPFDALVSLETTQEYHAFENKVWDYYVTDAVRNANAIKGSWLFVTGPTAVHMLADRFQFAERNYLTIPGLDHSDYLSQGVQRKYLKAKKTFEETDNNRYQQAAKGYAKVCNAIIDFFDAKLKGDSLSWKKLSVQSSNHLYGTDLYLEHMEVGQISFPIHSSAKTIPTPRQIKFLVQEGKIDTVVALLKRYWQIESRMDIYDPSVAYPLIQHLFTMDTVKATRLYEAYCDFGKENEIDKLFIFWARINQLRGFDLEVQKLYHTLYTLNPTNRRKVELLIHSKKE